MFSTTLHLISEILCYISAFGLSDYYVNNYKKIKGKQRLIFKSIMALIGVTLYNL